MADSTVRMPKRLVVLCDGTWQDSDYGWERNPLNPFDHGHPQIPTNVTRLARAILPESSQRHPQVVYYHSGVGSSSWNLSDQIFGGGLASGLSENIREGYAFLVNNYMEYSDGSADEIFLVGFSRGAFTARSIGGMICSIGLLKKEAMANFYDVFDDFENAGEKGYVPKLPVHNKKVTFTPSPDTKTYLSGYKKALLAANYTREVNIKCIAVWDTVGSLGLPVQPALQRLGFPTTLHKYRFFDTGINKRVEHAFHAMALDETRSAFQATIWEKEDDNDVTDLRQVWFSGAHSNIGGGYADSSQADLTLAWMINQLQGLLEVNDKYLFDQVADNIALNYAPDPKTGVVKNPWRWGLGTIYNALTFPTNLAGSATRLPDRYHEVVYASNKPIPDKLLKNTNEMVHASVRARLDNGNGWDGKKYKPNALTGWTYDVRDNKDGTTTATWKYSGQDDSLAGGRVLEEAPLGDYEKGLLARDPDMMTSLFPVKKKQPRT